MVIKMKTFIFPEWFSSCFVSEVEACIVIVV